MKAVHLLPPAAALLIAGLWLSSQRRSISALEMESSLLLEHLTVARRNGGAENDPSLATRLRHPKDGAIPRIDWRKVAAAQLESRGASGPENMRAMVELQKKLLAMTPGELLTQLDEIAALDVSDAVKRQLESTLAGVLANKDPQLALERFADRIGDEANGMSWQLGGAMKQWAAKDATAAAAWLDRMIDEGKFESRSLDGKSNPRLRFEANMVEALLSTDPAAAAARVTALPEDQRAQIFRQGSLSRMNAGSEKETADLVRSTLSAEQGAATLADLSRPLAKRGGLEEVGGFLGEINASAEERAAIVARTLEELNGGPTDIADTRAWILEQAPQDAERLSGQALGQKVGPHDFAEMAKIAEQYQQSSGKEDALVAFLMAAPESSRFEIMDLAEKIADPVKRGEVMSRFLNNPNR